MTGRPSRRDLEHASGAEVTPQAVAIACCIPEMITHAASHMFVTDLKRADLAGAA